MDVPYIQLNFVYETLHDLTKVHYQRCVHESIEKVSSTAEEFRKKRDSYLRGKNGHGPNNEENAGELNESVIVEKVVTGNINNVVEIKNEVTNQNGTDEAAVQPDETRSAGVICISDEESIQGTVAAAQNDAQSNEEPAASILPTYSENNNINSSVQKFSMVASPTVESQPSSSNKSLGETGPQMTTTTSITEVSIPDTYFTMPGVAVQPPPCLPMERLDQRTVEAPGAVAIRPENNPVISVHARETSAIIAPMIASLPSLPNGHLRPPVKDVPKPAAPIQTIGQPNAYNQHVRSQMRAQLPPSSRLVHQNFNNQYSVDNLTQLLRSQPPPMQQQYQMVQNMAGQPPKPVQRPMLQPQMPRQYFPGQPVANQQQMLAHFQMQQQNQHPMMMLNYNNAPIHHAPFLQRPQMQPPYQQQVPQQPTILRSIERVNEPVIKITEYHRPTQNSLSMTFTVQSDYTTYGHESNNASYTTVFPKGSIFLVVERMENADEVKVCQFAEYPPTECELQVPARLELQLPPQMTHISSQNLNLSVHAKYKVGDREAYVRGLFKPLA